MTELLKELEAQSKWLRKAAAEIAAEGHDGWGNACLQAADVIDTHHAEIAEALKDARTEREIQNAADKLPDGYNITVYIEKDAGWIDLTDPEGDPVHFDTDFDSFAEKIAEATKTATMHNSAREVGE